MTADRPAIEFLADARHFAREAGRIARDAHAQISATEYLAIRYCLLVVGEALDSVPQGLLAHEPGIPWRKVVALRHRLVHGYWLIDESIIAEIARNETEPLITALDRIITVQLQ
jgi:uncharacterized protein with HEPN domain